MLAFASAVKGFATEAFATTARPSYTLENVCLASVTYHLVVPQWGNSSSVGIARADDRDGKPIPCDGK